MSLPEAVVSTFFTATGVLTPAGLVVMNTTLTESTGVVRRNVVPAAGIGCGSTAAVSSPGVA